MSKDEKVLTIQDKLRKTKIVEKDIVQEMSKSFVAYAMAVNVSRAIPDVRDGLKPVHRRILFSMNDLGITHTSQYKKCARIVGDVLGKYHPHGDSSIYDALVRLAQDFSIRAPLVDGHGNFGSVDGDGAAAMRYTEARLSKIASELVKDIDKDTVDFYPNFDDTCMQPVVLPAKFPNLLVNGSEGIAVGMATSIPPHNLGEVIDATIALLNDPELEVDDLMEYIPCPDYPTGGYVLGLSRVRQAYRTGRGGVVMRARAEIEEVHGKHIIVVTEIPYQVNKANLIKDIAEKVKDKKLEGISNIRDESDRVGMRIVIEIKQNADPYVVLNSLYKQTNLQVSTGITLLALRDGVPSVLNLKEILEAYIAHQKEVLVRKTRFLLGKAEEREHILKGLVIALANIDEVIEVIKKSKDNADARENLMSKFELSEKQANAILEMQLRRLTSLEVDKLKKELEDIEKAIADYKDILAREERVIEIISTELAEVKETYNTPRKSELSFDDSDIDIEDLIEKEDIVVTMTYQGYLKRISLDEYRIQNRGGVGIRATNIKSSAEDDDFVTVMDICHTHDDILFFTNVGKVYRIRGFQIPEGSRNSRGRAAVNILPLAKDEKITTFISIDRESDDLAGSYLLMATKNGLVKKTALEEFISIRVNGKIAITLVDDDELIGVSLTHGDAQVIVASSGGKCIRFSEKDVRPTGRTSQGVKSMNISKKEHIVDMAVITSDDSELITISEYGFGKRSHISDYTLQRRAGKGVKAGNFTKETGGLVNLKIINEDEDIIVISDTGITIRVEREMVSLIGRATKGVRIMRLKDGGKVAALALTPHEDDAEFTAVEVDPDENPEEAAVEDIDDDTTDVDTPDEE